MGPGDLAKEGNLFTILHNTYTLVFRDFRDVFGAIWGEVDASSSITGTQSSHPSHPAPLVHQETSWSGTSHRTLPKTTQSKTSPPGRSWRNTSGGRKKLPWHWEEFQLGIISHFKGDNQLSLLSSNSKENTQTLLPSPPFSSFCLASQSSSPSKDISLGIIRSPSSCHISGCFNTASSKSRTLPQYHSNTAEAGATQDCNTKIGVNSAEVHLFHLISLIWIQVMRTEFLPYSVCLFPISRDTSTVYPAKSPPHVVTKKIHARLSAKASNINRNMATAQSLGNVHESRPGLYARYALLMVFR